MNSKTSSFALSNKCANEQYLADKANKDTVKFQLLSCEYVMLDKSLSRYVS